MLIMAVTFCFIQGGMELMLVLRPTTVTAHGIWAPILNVEGRFFEDVLMCE